eukprot:2187895-Prymnesium_polylepis.1
MRADPAGAMWAGCLSFDIQFNSAKKEKNNTIRTDKPTPGTLALFGDGRASLSHIVGWVDHSSSSSSSSQKNSGMKPASAWAAHSVAAEGATPSRTRRRSQQASSRSPPPRTPERSRH